MGRLRWVLVVSVISAALLFGVAGAGEQADGEEIVLDVQGMTCGSCAAKIQAALEKIDGVRNASVSFSAKQARIELDPGRVTADQLAATIGELGYRALERAANAKSGAEDGSTKTAKGASCDLAESQVADQDIEESGSSLTDEQVEKVITFVVNRLVDADAPGAMSRSVIEEGTGIKIPMSAVGTLQADVLARLQKDHPEVLASLESVPSRCAEYDACSLHGDLSGASGETLVMYRREKAEDGQVFDDHELPAFEAFDLEGNLISSDSLSGKPALLVFLAGHCTHSMDTFPVLNDLAREYGPRGLNIVGVVVNSGTPEDVGVWASHFEPEYDIWVYTDASIGDVIGSHLVPTYLYVDAGGNVREKLVGYKDAQVVDSWVARLVDSGPSVPGR